MTAIVGEPVRQIFFRHEHAARIVVADIQQDHRSSIIVLGKVVDGGGAAKSMHWKEADSETIKDGSEHAAHSAFLAYDHDAVAAADSRNHGDRIRRPNARIRRDHPKR